MAKTTKAKKPRAKKKVKKENHLKEMYQDFSETLSEIVGDTGEFAKQHKVLLLIGFVLFLWHRNKTFTITNFIEDFEERLKAKKSNW